MGGSYGLMLTLFGVFVSIARWMDIGSFRQIDPIAIQMVNLLFAFGLAWAVTGLIRNIWISLNSLANEP
jgi:hypothetical protein